MIRKTITINNELFYNLELTKLTQKYNSFSELVNNALQLLIEKQKKDEYKKAMIEASKDELYLKDMQEVENDFKYIDFENMKWNNMISI